MAAAELQDNIDEYHDALEQPLQQQPVMRQPPSAKIIKKNKQDGLAIHHFVEPKKFTIKDNEYLEYKKNILGKLEPDKSDKYCNFYLCNNIQQIKYFTENINQYAFNTELSEEHITNLTKKIYEDKDLYFVNPISLVEYTSASENSYKNLIELIDGHHRVKCLKKLINDYQYEEITFTFWIQVYKCKSEKESANLFRKYNTCKPFAINLGLIDLITLIIDKLNTQFNCNKFEFIKNTKSYRPSFSKAEFIEVIKSRLEDQLKTTNKDDYNDIDINTIISKFINYNKALQNESLDWFNQKCKKDLSKITENIYKKAKSNMCMLGLVPLDNLINQCVSL